VAGLSDPGLPVLKATIGSARTALNAGTSTASPATTNIVMPNRTKVTGSVGSTPNSIPWIKRVKTSAPATPMRTPVPARRPPSLRTMPRIAPL